MAAGDSRKYQQGEVGLFFVFRFSFFVFRFSLFAFRFSLLVFLFALFVIRFSLFGFPHIVFRYCFFCYSFFAFRFSLFDIRNRVEYRILIFKILFLHSNWDRISYFDIQNSILTFGLGPNIVF